MGYINSMMIMINVILINIYTIYKYHNWRAALKYCIRVWPLGLPNWNKFILFSDIPSYTFSYIEI